MKIKNAKYEISAVKAEQYPRHQLTEIALVGRSNVGKSSVINTLLGQKNLARVAATPGKTQTINFYSTDQPVYFADLPGYGFARVSKEMKASWGEMIEIYLNTREQLKLILMLVDIRHTPTQDDQLMYDWIKSRGIPSLVIATKLDKITRNQLAARMKDLQKTLGMNENEPIIPFSAVTRQGFNEVWRYIEQIVK